MSIGAHKSVFATVIFVIFVLAFFRRIIVVFLTTKTTFLVSSRNNTFDFLVLPYWFHEQWIFSIVKTYGRMKEKYGIQCGSQMDFRGLSHCVWRIYRRRI